MLRSNVKYRRGVGGGSLEPGAPWVGGSAQADSWSSASAISADALSRRTLQRSKTVRIDGLFSPRSICPIWDATSGNFSQRVPVIITEGISGAYFCDTDTPESTVQFLQYLQKYGIGLEVVFGTGLQKASVAPAGIFFRPRSPALLASRATGRVPLWKSGSVLLLHGHTSNTPK
jgi:hypothetical protein